MIRNLKDKFVIISRICETAIIVSKEIYSLIYYSLIANIKELEKIVFLNIAFFLCLLI